MKFRILRVGATYYPQTKFLWWWRYTFTEPTYDDYSDRAIGFISEAVAYEAVQCKFGPEARVVVREFEV